MITTPITLLTNDSVVAFQEDCIKTNGAKQSNPCGWLCHSEGNPLYKLKRSGLYHLNTTLNVSASTDGVVAFGVYLDGIKIFEGIENVIAGEYANISIDKEICVCDNATLTIQSIPTVVDPTTIATPPLASIETQIPIIISGNLQLEYDNQC
jgi:hypothetical protein